MGGSVSVKCNILSKKIWELFNENGCWILDEHVPGSHNTVANYMSRIFIAEISVYFRHRLVYLILK